MRKIIILGLICLLSVNIAHGVAVKYHFNASIEQRQKLGTMLVGLEKAYNMSQFVKIVYFENIAGKCGLGAVSGKVIVNLHPSCTCVYEPQHTLEHEIRHAYWFRMIKVRDRVRYCDAFRKAYKTSDEYQAFCEEIEIKNLNRCCVEYYAEIDTNQQI